MQIGYSKEPLNRFAILQVGSFTDLTLEAILPASQTNESQLHSKFGAYSVRGEWFKITPEIEDLISAHPCHYRPKPKGRPMNNDWSEPSTLTFGAFLFREIRDFCLHHDMASTAFGRNAVGDWKLVSQIRAGRDLRLSTVHKIKEYIASYRQECGSVQ